MYLYLRNSLLNELMAPKPTFSVMWPDVPEFLRVVKEEAGARRKEAKLQETKQPLKQR
ncbi:hypothetical protein NDS46_13375 [Paenibacillus thiaminolyticus]|uniref:hypothetical protein n=1 Tax=Paenibacillus thiaminolyticus TaxID=49283 RepID=UPI00232C99A5|nr:hypothetical protein [Paenibacillus thiaminolyticus]WCF10770.1 hypothetical protein NDS46_13375 [Paenibacillus thiaminolyticus]